MTAGGTRISRAEAHIVSSRREPRAATGRRDDIERLRVRGVSKRWPGSDAPVLDAVDLTLAPATVASLVGANGVGKTTLLRVVAGLIFPDAGTVELDGLNVRSDRREFQRRIGFVPAGHTGLYARFSVRSHLEYWARVAFVPRRERRHAVERALRQFALEPLARQRPERLSMGQRQRLRLALGFLHRPSLALLDEPHTSLDHEGLEMLHDAVARQVEAGGTTLWCAPTADEVAVDANVRYTLVRGRVTRS
jgi:ABC-type multidrug transport system ATPase subunit